MSVRTRVRSTLATNEVVIHQQSPDVWAWLFGRLPELFAALLCIAIIGSARSELVTDVGLFAVAWITVDVAAGFLQRRFTRYVITQYRVIRFTGVLRLDHEWMLWKKVTDVSVRRSFVDRWFHTATIKIQSANEASGFKEMNDLAHPMDFAQIVVDLVNATHKPVPVATRRT